MIHNGLSYKDLQLGEQINEVLNEYNSLAKKINESRQDIMNNSSIFAHKHKSSYNYDKPKLKKMSYISKKEEKNYNNYYYNPRSMFKNYNDNTLSHRKNESFCNKNDLIEEFKKTIGKSQMIKDGILNSYRNKGGKSMYKSATINNASINSSFFKKRLKKKSSNKIAPNTKINKYKIKKILNNSLKIDDYNDSYSNGGALITNGQSKSGRDVFNANISFKNKKLNNDFDENELLNYNAKEKLKLEFIRDTLIKAYQKIKKDNRILEVEINNYKKLVNQYFNHNNNYNNKYRLFNNGINNYKKTLNNNIQNNCRIIDLIINILKQNKFLSNKIKSIKKKNRLILQKIEQRNRENAEIQIINEENEQKLINL